MLAYSGRGTFVVEPIEPIGLVKHMTQLLHASIPKKVKIEIRCSDNLPALMCDATQVRQVLMNLVLNASEAMDGKGGLIRLSSCLLEADAQELRDARAAGETIDNREYLLFEVSDNGPGIDAERLAKISTVVLTRKHDTPAIRIVRAARIFKVFFP